MARVQRMPPAGRWALGLGFAFLSGMAFLFSPWIGVGNIPFGAVGFLLVLLLLTLVAGFVLSSWWAVAPLTVAVAAGALLAGLVFTWISPDAMGGGINVVYAMLAFSAILGLGPVILFLLGGVGLGKQQGLALGEPHALSTREATVSKWLAALGPVIGAGYLAPPVRFTPGAQFGVEFTISMTLYAVLLAATCLMAGWLLHSWTGLVTVPVVYVGVAALASLLLPWFGGGADWTGWKLGFALYIALPAVVMAVIGTGIGMYGGRRGGQRPRYAQVAT